MSARDKLPSRKVCCFCNLTEDNELEYGKFHEYNGIVTHYYCLLLSSNMEQKGDDNEGILGFLTEDIQKELRRGRRLVCSYCKKIGATLGCCNVKCKRIFHFPCGLKTGSLHQYFGEFRSYCINHRPKQQIDEHILKQINPLDNILCYICYDKVDPNDFTKTLWAPCCKKNTFFHCKCVQQLALSAGYFFKCPLCNNKQDFRKAMLEYGIFIPSQDASWELVPNAFEELLYRHDQCDAVKCLCPKGRKHVSSNAKWELTLCRICGSQGIHKACGQLKWANSVWECPECTLILYNSKKNKDAESDNSSDDLNKDSDSDSNSTDTDISVGMDFPKSCPSPSVSSNSSLMSLPYSTSDIKLRPGPRSFKLQQQMIKWLKLTQDTFEKNVTKISQETNISKNDNNEKSLTNKENNTLKERRVSSSNVTSQLIKKETDVITIESDDDNEIEIVTLKRKTNLLPSLQLTSQSSTTHVSPKDNIKLNTIENSISKISNATLINLLEKDIEHKFNGLRKISNKNESIISEQLDVIPSQKFMSDFITLDNNDLDYLNTENVEEISQGGNPIMNIKITNVTSLPPEVFESVPVTLHENSVDTSSPSTSKLLEKLVLPSKRMYEEVSSVASNCKKIKKDNFDEKFWEKTSTFCDIVANEQHNEEISPTNEIQENKNLKCTSVNELSNLCNNQKDDLSTKFILLHNVNNIRYTSQVAKNNSKENIATFDIQQSNAIPVKAMKTYLPSSKHKSQVYLSFGNCYSTLMPDSKLTTSQDVEKNRDMHSISSILPITNDVSVNNHSQTVVVSQSVALNTTVPVVANGNQAEVLDEKKILMKEKIFADVSSSDDNFSSSIFCDGDAGTCPAEIDSTDQKKIDPSSDEFCNKAESCKSVDNSNVIELHNVANRSVFPRVTNNCSTCHQPRLIPQYMNLHDLKFRVCKSDSIQMVLYDTFSVNIPIKNSKESRIRSTNNSTVAQWKSKELSYHAPDEASSSVEYIDDIQTAEQQSVKFFCSSKNASLINDKYKYVVCNQDDAKENLDPVKSKILSHNTFDNSDLMNDVSDTMTVYDSFCDETNNEMHLVSHKSNTNLSALNRLICRDVEDSVIDDVPFVSNGHNQTLQVNWENIKHKRVSIYNMMPAPIEEKIARLFCKETSKIVHNIDFDFSIIKTNKNIEKILQDDITVFRHKDRKISNNHTDNSQMILWNNYKLDNANIMRPKVQNWSACVSNIIFNEHSILNKQIDAADSVKFLRCLTFDKDTVNYSKNNFERNSKFCIKVSIDLYKIQSLIDSKPELFVNQKRNVYDK